MLLTQSRGLWMSTFEFQLFSPSREFLKELRDKQNATKLVFSWPAMQDQLVFSKPAPVQVSSSRPSTAFLDRIFMAVKDFLTSSCKETPPIQTMNGLWQPHQRDYGPKKGKGCLEGKQDVARGLFVPPTPQSLSQQAEQRLRNTPVI